MQEQALQKARAEADIGSLAATTSALQQMCLQLHATAADNAAAAKAAETQVQSVVATNSFLVQPLLHCVQLAGPAGPSCKLNNMPRISGCYCR